MINEQELLETTDARRWTQDFITAMEAKGIQTADEGWLITWFSCAIETGRTAGIRAVPKVQAEVARERLRQDERWGGQEHDDQHSIQDFKSYMFKRMIPTEDAENQRVLLIELAALAIAAVESMDRKAIKEMK